MGRKRDAVDHKRVCSNRLAMNAANKGIVVWAARETLRKSALNERKRETPDNGGNHTALVAGIEAAFILTSSLSISAYPIE